MFGLDNLFKGENNLFKSINNIFNAMNGFSGENRSRSSNNRFNGRLCNSKVITMEEAHKKILENNIFILDVRTENEFNIIKIKGAINIPIDKLESYISKVEPNKDREILVYCATGVRSKLAVQILYKLGYNHIFVWEGAGINNFKYSDIIEKNNNIIDTPSMI